MNGWFCEGGEPKTQERENSQNSARLKRRREADDGTIATTTELDGAEETRSEDASFNMNPDGGYLQTL